MQRRRRGRSGPVCRFTGRPTHAISLHSCDYCGTKHETGNRRQLSFQAGRTGSLPQSPVRAARWSRAAPVPAAPPSAAAAPSPRPRARTASKRWRCSRPSKRRNHPHQRSSHGRLVTRAHRPNCRPASSPSGNEALAAAAARRNRSGLIPAAFRPAALTTCAAGLQPVCAWIAAGPCLCPAAETRAFPDSHAPLAPLRCAPRGRNARPTCAGCRCGARPGAAPEAPHVPSQPPPAAPRPPPRRAPRGGCPGSHAGPCSR